ncbi:uncharacterized protein LOC105844616 isoform X2 [Hydra vulgaris]|uniref:uncharacterized protein LOC105844616 isoform X2 n=1 Tax=Hydra vulgaris TaxID=6087 RepID=UPI0032E9E148
MEDIFMKNFRDFDEAEKSVIENCRMNFHPVKIDSKEKVEHYNKKVKEGSQICCIPLNAIYGCRWICKHYGEVMPSVLKRGKGLRENSVLASGCKMAIYVAYKKEIRSYYIKKKNLVHNYPHGPEQFGMYSSERQPKGVLEQQTMLLLSHGANPTLITDNLNRHGLKTRPRDIYNIKQRMKFKGPALDEVIKVLELPNVISHIDANLDRKVECITWITTEQLNLLKKYPECIMLDGTYKINNFSMPLYTMAVVDQNGMG